MFDMAVKLEIANIIKNLQDKGVLNLNEQDIKTIKGTTDGLVYTVSENSTPKYVLKFDNSQQIDFVEQFLRSYLDVSLLPKVLYTGPEKNFIVYSFIPGTTHYNRGSKINWMSTLVKELLNHYKKYDQTVEWGRLGIPRRSWYEFNAVSVDEAYKNIGDLLPIEDYFKVKSCVERIGDDEHREQKYLLHGDTGVHNFVYTNSVLTGIIDPSPIIGPVIYDFTYAFCSSPDDLNSETLLKSYSLLEHVSIEQSRLIEEVVVQLYTRIGICVKVHPYDLADYLGAWEYWRALIPPTT
jgi:Phosphotransferase enzyme family